MYSSWHAHSGARTDRRRLPAGPSILCSKVRAGRTAVQAARSLTAADQCPLVNGRWTVSGPIVRKLRGRISHRLEFIKADAFDNFAYPSILANVDDGVVGVDGGTSPDCKRITARRNNFQRPSFCAVVGTTSTCFAPAPKSIAPPTAGTASGASVSRLARSPWRYRNAPNTQWSNADPESFRSSRGYRRSRLRPTASPVFCLR